MLIATSYDPTALHVTLPLSVENGGTGSSTPLSYLPLSGGTMTGAIVSTGVSGATALDITVVNDYAIRAISSTSYGVLGQSTSGIGVAGISSSNFGLRGDSISNYSAWLNITPATTDSLDGIIRAERLTSETAEDGIGGSIDFWLESNGGTNRLSARIGALLSSATDADEASALVFYTATAGGAPTEAVRIDSDKGISVGGDYVGVGKVQSARLLIGGVLG